jgi:type I restriction enzyme S subunit
MSDRLRLGNLVSLQRGTTYKSALIGEPGPVLLGLGTIARNGGFRDDDLRTYGGDSPAKLLVYPGELFLSLKDVTHTADLLGAVARVPKTVGRGRLTQDTVKLIPLGNTVSLEYIHWMLRAPQYREYCRSRSTGTTNLGLSRNDFLSYEIPPPTEGRGAIVALLGALDDKISANALTTAGADQLALLSFERKKRDPKLVSEASEFTIDELIRDGALVMSDGYRTSRAELGASGYRIIRVADVQKGEIALDSEDFVSEAHSQSIGAKSGREGDVLLTTKGTVGRVAVVRRLNERVVYSPQICFFRVRDISRLDRWYLKQWLGSEEFLNQASHRMNNSDMAPYISLTDIRSLRISLPPIGRQRELSQILGPLEAKIAASAEENRSLAIMRDTLLELLMSGKLRVKDAEKQVEGVV